MLVCCVTLISPPHLTELTLKLENVCVVFLFVWVPLAAVVLVLKMFSLKFSS